MSTEVAKEQDVKRDWFVVDLEDVVLGRAATEIARVLRGKHKPIYTPSVDTGDFVIVLNADKIRLTGNKLADKMYYHHSGYPGGIKEISAEKLLEKNLRCWFRLRLRACFLKTSWAAKCLVNSRFMLVLIIHMQHKTSRT